MNWESFNTLARYVGITGVLLYVLVWVLLFLSKGRLNHEVVVATKATAWIMMLTPVLLRWYLSEHVLLWLGVAIAAIGLGYKFRSWLRW